jgi:hypothetical protein
MMGYRYWTFGRRRAAGWHAIETKRPAPRGGGCDPEGDLAEERLPIPAAISLWGVFSIFGWLIVAQGAFYLGYAAPHLLTVNSHVTAIETAIGETSAFSLRH